MWQDIFSCHKQKHSQATSRKGRCGGEVASESFTLPGTETGTETWWEARLLTSPIPLSLGAEWTLPGSELPLFTSSSQQAGFPCSPRIASSDRRLPPDQEKTSPAPLFLSCLLASTLITSCCIPRAHLISNSIMGLYSARTSVQQPMS